MIGVLFRFAACEIGFGVSCLASANKVSERTPGGLGFADNEGWDALRGLGFRFG